MSAGDPLSVRCPVCFVSPGDACYTTGIGERQTRKHPHAARAEAAGRLRTGKARVSLRDRLTICETDRDRWKAAARLMEEQRDAAQARAEAAESEWARLGKLYEECKRTLDRERSECPGCAEWGDKCYDERLAKEALVEAPREFMPTRDPRNFIAQGCGCHVIVRLDECLWLFRCDKHDGAAIRGAGDGGDATTTTITIKKED